MAAPKWLEELEDRDALEELEEMQFLVREFVEFEEQDGLEEYEELVEQDEPLRESEENVDRRSQRGFVGTLCRWLRVCSRT